MTMTEDKRRYVAEALAIIRTADSEAEREELLKQLRDASGISFEALKRDLQSGGQSAVVKKEPPPVRKDTADSSKKASRFVLSGFLFGADYTQGQDVADVPFKDEVHVLIAKYIRSKILMEEPIRISELFEFFDEKTPDFEELNRILDNSEGGGFTGDVAEKYFNDCLTKLYLDDIDDRIAEEKRRLGGVDDIKQRAAIAQNITALTRQKEKIKNGERK